MSSAVNLIEGQRLDPESERFGGHSSAEHYWRFVELILHESTWERLIAPLREIDSRMKPNRTLLNVSVQLVPCAVRVEILAQNVRKRSNDSDLLRSLGFEEGAKTLHGKSVPILWAEFATEKRVEKALSETREYYLHGLWTVTTCYIETACWSAFGKKSATVKFKLQALNNKRLWKSAYADCEQFWAKAWQTCRMQRMKISSVGKELYFTRNEHGTGFWDSVEYPKDFTTWAKELRLRECPINSWLMCKPGY